MTANDSMRVTETGRGTETKPVLTAVCKQLMYCCCTHISIFYSGKCKIFDECMSSEFLTAVKVELLVLWVQRREVGATVLSPYSGISLLTEMALPNT
jgi:hypothetical protein